MYKQIIIQLINASIWFLTSQADTDSSLIVVLPLVYIIVESKIDFFSWEKRFSKLIFIYLK
jgi:hypothetical protein